MDEIEETDEYWIVLGIYIRALWEQVWIKEIFGKRKGLFSLSDNIDYFFDKVTACMEPQYKVSDEVTCNMKYDSRTENFCNPLCWYVFFF